MAAVVMPGLTEAINGAVENVACTKPLDLYLFGFSAEEASESLRCMGQASRGIYRAGEQRHDVFYPISYAAFFALSIYLLFTYCTGRKSLGLALALLPVLAMLFDFVENSSIVALIDQYPNLNPETVARASLANTVKWLFAFVSLSAIVVFSIWALVKRCSRRPSRA
jgi:hypothetical protein